LPGTRHNFRTFFSAAVNDMMLFFVFCFCVSIINYRNASQTFTNSNFLADNFTICCDEEAEGLLYRCEDSMYRWRKCL
jgi:hypothetical protein